MIYFVALHGADVDLLKPLIEVVLNFGFLLRTLFCLKIKISFIIRIKKVSIMGRKKETKWFY